jgi:hypothetical protein
MRFPLAVLFLAGGGLQLAFADAVGSTFDDGDIGVMGQAVEGKMYSLY